MQPVALYIHFPFCRSRCTYCDFNAHAAPEHDEPQAAYLDALVGDIESQERVALRSIFMGGGTPSLYSGARLARVLEAVRARFEWPHDIEVTMEANPGTVDRSKLEQVREAGVNRISFGVQSFTPRLLALLNRIHSAEEAALGVAAAREAGFDNLSLDLIFGLPQQALEDWEDTLQQALALAPDHLSVYQLTVEPSTRLEAQIRTGELEPPPEEVTLAMDGLTRRVLKAAGFSRYEVSNWARPGRECLHNLIYWRDEPYLGVGCGAVSFLNGWRTKRIQHPHYFAQAMAAGRSPIVEAERMGTEGALKDALMMGLRTREGVCLERLATRFAWSDRQPLSSFLATLPEGWVEQSGSRLRLTEEGLDFHSEIYVRMMDVLLTPPAAGPSRR